MLPREGEYPVEFSRAAHAAQNLRRLEGDLLETEFDCRNESQGHNSAHGPHEVDGLPESRRRTGSLKDGIVAAARIELAVAGGVAR